jgi:spore germination cell wall hydrolase CwlJ-like protein
MTDRECLARAMYFESRRDSEEGMLAVGTVVMNRAASDQYPDTPCAVVGQRRQFADGVLSRAMTEERPRQLADRVAGDVLGGARHPALAESLFFHTAGYRYRYSNMDYLWAAGGNVFYARVPRERRLPTDASGYPPELSIDDLIQAGS